MFGPTLDIKINYPPKFERRYGGEKPNAEYIEKIFKQNQEQQLSFLKEIAANTEKFLSIPVNASEESAMARWNQVWFPPLDAMSLYTLIALRKPKVYMEIGSGNSTKFAFKAKQDFNLDTKIISIDPHPREEIDDICDEIIRRPLEDLERDYFSSLGSQDILFFDGSHRSFQNSDVTVFFIDVIPSLKTGTTIGIHDIFWPVDYPEKWIERYYNEQYLLGAYMLALGADFPLLYSCGYMSQELNDKVRAALGQSFMQLLRDNGLSAVGGALWFSKPATRF